MLRGGVLMLLPFCTVDEVREEIAEIEQVLDGIGAHHRIVDHDQAVARRARLNRWRQRLAEQLAEMESSA